MESFYLQLQQVHRNFLEKFLFGLLFDFSEGRPQREASVNNLERQWIQSYKSELKAQCFGIALVTHSSFMLLFLKNISIYFIKRKYGCSVAIFESRIDAQMWLMDQYLLPRPVSNQDIILTPRIPMK